MFKILKGKYLLSGLAALAMVIGVVAGPVAETSAVTCRVFTPIQEFYEGGRVATVKLTVPGASVSGCRDINIRDVKDPARPSDTCATFLVAMYPTSGGTIYTNPKHVCSKGPNGPVVPIATNVINGTKYRVLYNIEYLEQRINFKVVD